MIKIDLISGFLGSGKTTFLKKYADYWIRQGCRIGILENDFGAVNVDMMLLQDLLGENCDLEMIAGGCGYDCHIRRFRTKLISFAMQGMDRVLVEPSGIFDVDEFFDVLREEPLDAWYEIGSVLAIVDARLEEDLTEETEYLLASQIASAGKVLLSKVNEASEEDIHRTIAHMNGVMERFLCSRRFGNDVLTADWKDLTDAELAEIGASGCRLEAHLKLQTVKDNSFNSVYCFHVHLKADQLKAKVTSLFEDPSFGRVFRVKGFVRDENGWTELNAAGKNISLKAVEAGQEIVIVIGEELQTAAIYRHFGIEAETIADVAL
ncbi:MAG: GTPase (G3E family) [Lachnospiraceae bacterium]|nr:GTPase (G3E family) [Lachnospiraceae bacterium]